MVWVIINYMDVENPKYMGITSDEEGVPLLFNSFQEATEFVGNNLGWKSKVVELV